VEQPEPIRRIVVYGIAGSGKTTLAAHLARALGVPHVELDALFHRPDWSPAPVADFTAAASAATAGNGWVVEGAYSQLQPVIWPKAQLLVALDLPRRVVLPRIVRRSVRRVVSREELWNGNRERLRNLVIPDPRENIILWSWVRHSEFRQRITAFGADAGWPGLRVVRLRSRAAVRHWTAGFLAQSFPDET
jgi:adenylate kinase family enzyme